MKFKVSFKWEDRSKSKFRNKKFIQNFGCKISCSTDTKRKCEDNINMNPTEILYEDVNCTGQVHSRF